MNLDAPPQFQETAQTVVAPDPELPSYSRNDSSDWDVPPLVTEHSYHLSKKTAERWLTVTLTSRARDPADTPLFFQGGLISGFVRTRFEKEELIDSISATVCVEPHYHIAKLSRAFMLLPLSEVMSSWRDNTQIFYITDETKHRL